MLYVVLHISKHGKQWKKSRGHHFVCLRGRRSKGKGKGIWARDRASLAFFSRLKLPFPKYPFLSLSNACHAGYHFVPECNHAQDSQTNQFFVVFFYRGLFSLPRSRFFVSSRNTPPYHCYQWMVTPQDFIQQLLLSIAMLCPQLLHMHSNYYTYMNYKDTFYHLG